SSFDGLQYLNTSNVTDMSSMFSGCSSLTSLDLSGFDTGKVTDMSNMFSGCSSLVTIIVGDGWNTSSVMASSSMFEGCSNIIGGNGTRYNAGFTDKTYARVDGRGGQGYLTAKQAYVVYDSFAKILTFYYDLDISKNNGSPVGLKTWGFDIDRVEFTRAFADYKPTSTSHWFEGCSNLSSESIDGLQYLNTSEVTDMSSMFSGCSSLTSLDLSGFDTGKVTDMNSMFYGCYELTTITVGDGWTTSNVTASSGMFDGCSNLKGGNGTVYNASYIDKTYARIDGKEGLGYFTASPESSIATGIESVVNGKQSTVSHAPMFNLQGQRVNDSYKGVVIQNGRKMLKK
ncbi:MAG: BspA family leucine-rich repeat surface protein, partial [Prevotella sp.]|nr:BspA family leucine-rich repeat surface protein [Prevotella sp.]